MGLPQAKVIVLDALRKQRNLADYSGDLISQAAAAECLAGAQDLFAHVRAWLAANQPGLTMEQRAKRGSRKKFDAALAQVPDGVADKLDRK